jgi:Protein of unknown function (DUF3592)
VPAFALCGTLGFLFGRDIYFGWVSTTWPSVSGIITASSVEASYTSKPRRQLFRPQISYEYHMYGQQKVGNTVTFGSSSRGSDRDSALSWVKQFPIGSAVAVFVDPSTSDRSVLHPGLTTTEAITSVIAIVFAILLAVGFIVAIRA